MLSKCHECVYMLCIGGMAGVADARASAAEFCCARVPHCCCLRGTFLAMEGGRIFTWCLVRYRDGMNSAASPAPCAPCNAFISAAISHTCLSGSSSGRFGDGWRQVFVRCALMFARLYAGGFPITLLQPLIISKDTTFWLLQPAPASSLDTKNSLGYFAYYVVVIRRDCGPLTDLILTSLLFLVDCRWTWPTVPITRRRPRLRAAIDWPGLTQPRGPSEAVNYERLFRPEWQWMIVDFGELLFEEDTVYY